MSGRESSGGRVVLLLILALVLLFGGGYATAYYAADGKTPRDTTVAGVDIGNRTVPDAVRALRQGLHERADRPITVVVNGRSRRVAPSDAGLRVDYEASVRQAVAQPSWRLSWMWDQYAGGNELDPVISLDEAAMDATVARLDAVAGTPATNGAIAFRNDGSLRITQPEAGTRLDLGEARAALEAAYLQDDPTAELALHQEQPDIDAGDLQKAMTRFANPAVAGSVQLLFGHTPVRLQPREYASALSMVPENGRLVPSLDERALRRLVARPARAAGAPVDATISLAGGVPHVVPARPGKHYDAHHIGKAFLSVVARNLGHRSTTVPGRTAEPERSTRDARRLRIRERVSGAAQRVPSVNRGADLVRAVAHVDGTVLDPGETFSLDETVGGLGGYADTEALSGLATALFGAMFDAGLADVAHRPHPSYDGSFPPGLDAAVTAGSDLRFRNNTPYGVLVHAAVTSYGVAVSLWSTPYWDITSSSSGRYDVVRPGTRTLTTSDCQRIRGYAGFTVDVTRHFRRHGRSTLDHNEAFHTRYAPADRVVCR